MMSPRLFVTTAGGVKRPSRNASICEEIEEAMAGTADGSCIMTRGRVPTGSAGSVGIGWPAGVSRRVKIFHFLSAALNRSPNPPIVSDGPSIRTPSGFRL